MYLEAADWSLLMEGKKMIVIPLNRYGCISHVNKRTFVLEILIKFAMCTAHSNGSDFWIFTCHNQCIPRIHTYRNWHSEFTHTLSVNTFRPTQNSRHLATGISKQLKENV